MKVIIAGSRGIESLNTVHVAIQTSKFEITEVVSGTARGVDRLGEQWAANNHIKVRRFPANWNLYGKSAGYKRNERMASYADALVAVWDGESKGTRHMIDLADEYGLKVFVYQV